MPGTARVGIDTINFTSSQNVASAVETKMESLVVVRVGRGKESADLSGTRILSTLGTKA